MKPTAVLSWIVILVIALGIPILREVNSGASSTQPSEQAEPIDMPFTLSGKYLYGASRFEPSTKGQLMSQLDQAAREPIQKVAAAVMEAELNGEEKAIERLQAIGTADAAALTAWYQSDTPLPADTVTRLGWFGELAQTYGQPDDSPARRPVLDDARMAVGVLMGFGILLLLVGVCGLGLFITAVILLALGKMRFRTTAPRGPSHVYVEAFALYLSSYLIGSIVISVFLPDTGMVVHVLPLVFGVLLGVLWPLVRGVRFETQRADWGIHTGSNVFLEAIWGVLGYFAGLPIVGLMLLVTLALSRLAGTTVSHPISNEIANQPWTMLFIAAVFAPITEELLFRGGFVSHLRGAWGVVMSACISGFIFAAIHPQGWAAIPVLMGIGAVFAIIRQWRDSLVPSIVAHALNNGCLVGLMILLSR